MKMMENFFSNLENMDQIIKSDYHNNNIQWYENDGEFIDKFGKKGRNNIGEFNNPNGLCFDLIEEYLLICDSYNYRIQKIKI